ncbi:helicase-like transcription factor CHR28 [Malania oleifera]|uniref:helicase-like transcription factor CHR28 n=1 Tax=Malania oleifera TaxID=397392 RepID=UPI0025AE56C2|nr:helicase-like transcription factor CHR28 [Malania oleifera]
MLMMDDTFDFLGGDGDSDEPSIDLDALYNILEEDLDPPQSISEDLSFKNVPHGESVADVGNQQNSPLQNGFREFGVAQSSGAELQGSFACLPPGNSEAAASRVGGSDGSFESAGNSTLLDHGNRELSSQIGSSMHGYPGGFKDCLPVVPGQDPCYPFGGAPQNLPLYSRNDSTERQYNLPNFNTIFCSSAGNANQFSDYTENRNHDCFDSDGEFQLKPVEGDAHAKYFLRSPIIETSDVNFEKHGVLSEYSMGSFGAPERYSCTSMELSIMDFDCSSPSAIHTQSGICQISDGLCETSNNHYSAVQYGMGDNGNHLTDPAGQYLCGVNLQFIPNNEETMIDIKNEKESLTENSLFPCDMQSSAHVGRACCSVSDLSGIDCCDAKGFNIKCQGGSDVSPSSVNSSSNANGKLIDEKASTQAITCSQPYIPTKKQVTGIKEERKCDLVEPEKLMCQSVDASDQAVIRKFSPSVVDTCADKGFGPPKWGVYKDSKLPLHDILPSKSSMKHVVRTKIGKESFLASEGETNCVNFTDGNLETSASGLHQSLPFNVNSQLDYIKDEREGKLNQPKSMGSHMSKISSESIHSNSLAHKSHVDDDSDICILEDISQPPRLNPCRKSLVTPQRPSFNEPLHHMGVGGMRLKANDERLILRVALQDLSQPKSETSPPDGALTVPLLRHQRIALSWMVQKETGSVHCSGGILADDQGLGKTISTIALILKERPPSLRVCEKDMKQSELETLNLDEDDGILDIDGSKQEADSCQAMSNGSPVKSRNAFVRAKGRPAAGTLVVCPTSVLRQWADELHNKVTSEANLSVLVYHGSNRPKDPCELAKYDVVLTTYSIVSLEVPKQPLVDKEDDEKGRSEADLVSPMGLSSTKKRKYPPSSDKRCLKGKKGVDSAFLESVARPLARVGWFRVVLDEAQSIKNHRTQVARACWGLRAKRRWCLSGTPIQNAVDDLYSYFRFLRYDPYAVYKSFCSSIKVPINRNPANGYRKLQAVLKTIMLRRTKGTLLDGEPIITLPPKSVELKKVDFSKEERDFYSRLEADSRAQFEVYAAAGTVKQNYVNILLMLLRLRQACDHPFLVKGYDSNAVWKSSVDSARNLPQGRQIDLLHCLEASLAICGKCNDPPEDAVVSICGHVFCNQCISEHLNGDDKHCPAVNCKAQLNASSVFTKATLNSSLSDQSSLSDHSCPNNSLHCSGSEYVEALEPCSDGRSFDSSKIKAALEVLESLSKPRDSRVRVSSLKSSDGTASCPQNLSDLHSVELLEDMPVRENWVVDKGLNNTISVAGEKAIVFSQWTRMLDLLEANLKDSSIQYRRLDGTMSIVARDKAVKDFNTLPEVSVMIMSLKAASLGLNMVAACHVLLLDLWWNPTTEDQAIDRAHRIGQTRPVTVVRLTVKDTVEDRILALQQKKREMVASAFGEDETGSRQTRLTVDDLKYLFMA